MKKIILLFLIISSTQLAYSQVGISYHSSSHSFFGVNYTIKDRVIGELRAHANASDFGFEPTLMYIFNKGQSFSDVYAGVGYWDSLGAVTIPFGVNVYPFENKQFGFHLEAALITDGEGELRGSWGARYRFN